MTWSHVVDCLSNSFLKAMDKDKDGQISVEEWEGTPWDKLIEFLHENLLAQTKALTEALRINETWSVTALVDGGLHKRFFCFKLSIDEDSEVTGSCQEEDITDRPVDLQHKFDKWRIKGLVGADRIEVKSCDNPQNCYWRIVIQDPSIIKATGFKTNFQAGGSGLVYQNTLGAVARNESFSGVEFSFSK